MKKRLERTLLRFCLPTAIAFVTYIVGPAQAIPLQGSPESEPAPNSKVLSRMMLPGTQDLQLIVQLSEPSVIELLHASEPQASSAIPRALAGASRMDLQSSQAGSHRGRLASSHQQLINNLVTLPGVEVQGSVSNVLNAVIARVPARQYNAVRRLPGVKKVYFSRPQRLLLDTSAALMNAQGLWSNSGGKDQAGRGVKIGIIDTGVDITNPMLIDSSLVPPAGFPKYDTTADQAFTNSKVIVARNYISLLANRQSVRTAVDEVGHGTFISGAAAGKQVAAPLATISGMAPGAFIGSYKIFGTPGINDTTTTAATVAAIDDAVADGMDVLNLSLGALDYVLPADDPETPVLENVINAGVVVAIAAGNDGPLTHTISNPGGTPGAITVGSVSNSRTFMSQLRVTAPAPVPQNLSNMPYLPGDGPSITTGIPSTAIGDVQTLDGNGLGCSALPSGSLSGKIAFIQRGSCTFAIKVANAASAGAAVALLYNNDPSGGIIYMGGLTNTTIPAVMISNPDGLNLKSFIAVNPSSARVQIDSNQTLTYAALTPRVISSFSAVGPAPDFGMKPDLVAVGEDVYSATESVSPNGELFSSSKFLVSQGTSFSTPMVAGAAAGLKKLFPGLSALEIKSLIVNTASRNLTLDGANPPNVIQAGSGLLDIGAASSAVAVFSPTNLNFGTQSCSGSLSLTRTFTIKNISSSTDQYSVSFEQLVPGPNLSLSRSTTGSVTPRGTTSIDVSLQVAAPLTGAFQGFVVVQSSANSSVYRIPYWAGLYVPDSSRKLTVSQSSSGSDTFSSLAAAIYAARPGNIIEIADSGTYPTGSTGLTITTNNEGLPLNGITIRAAAGKTPTIDGSQLTDGVTPDILVVGLQNVQIQGLSISGGSTGIWFVQPSTALPLSATVDHCTISNITAGPFPTGIEVDGGSVDVTQSTIATSSGTGLFVTQGSYLTLLSSTVQNNPSDGMDAVGSNVQVLKSTFSNNLGEGLYVESCTGTIDGSTFSTNQAQNGQFGDGLYLADGNFTITNNTFDSNDRLGIGFWTVSGTTGPGPIVTFTGNTVHANKNIGVYANPGQNLRIDGNLIKDNARGVRFFGPTAALLVNNIIVRSTDSTVGDGIEVAGSSNVRMVNNTVYKNALQGIVLSSGATLSVYNTIVSSNGSGDLQGLPAGSVQYSLIGKSPPAGNNITGDPKFVNPDSDVFDLSSGSPALDAGSNSVPDLPFLDFNRRLRVASTSGLGTLPGNGIVDIGASEASSAYPLVFPLLANGTQPIFGDTYTTGIAVLNYGSSGVAANFTAYSPLGGLLGGTTNPATRTIGSAAQIPILDYQLFGFDPASQSLGGVLASSLQRIAGFFLIFDPSFARLTNGTSVSDQTATDLVFMRHEFDSAGKATYVLFNPGVNPANITANLWASSGTLMDAPKTATIAPKGQFIFAFNAVTSSSGYVRVQSDRPISGLELYGNTQQISVLGYSPPGSEARLFFPHIALNQGYTTLIGMTNPNSTTANVELTAYSDDGQILGTPASRQLGPNGQLLQEASDLFGIGSGSLTTGYVVAESDQAGVQGFTAFSYNDGIHQSAAAVPVDAVPRQHLLFSHVAHQVPAGSGESYLTGVALLNPFGTTIDYTIKVFDGSGNLVAQKSDVLAPHQKVAKILSHPQAGAGFFTQALPLSSGHIEVQTSYGLLGFELFFTQDLSQLASVPAQIGN
jgi:parallel beta-helix repeat protein